MGKTTEELAKQIRIFSLEMVHRAKASHIGSALSIADILAVLYGEVMHFSADDPEAETRDRFILSKGHACVANYAALGAIGTLTDEELKTYGEDYSPLMNHISHKVRGVEFSTGSLGHGLPFGTGKALSAKLSKQSWRTFVLVGDGEMQEGSNWEALMFAAHHSLNNLCLIIDYNNLQSLTTVKDTLSLNPLDNKIEAFGWEVRLVDGHDHRQMSEALVERSERPLCIICKTIKGKGVSFMENQVSWHYSPPNTAQFQSAIEEIRNA